MNIFGRKKVENNCAHKWHVADYETVYSNAGYSVDVDDYFILRCNTCGKKRKVGEYELSKLRRLGLINGGETE